MSILAKLPPHARTVAALGLAAVVFVFVTTVLQFGSWFWEGHKRISDLEPRVARLLGYRENEEQLRASVELVNAQLEGMVFASEVDAGAAGAAIQQDARRVLEGAGMSVQGSQVIGNTVYETLEEIRVNISASGNMEALDQSLFDLGNARPLFMMHSLEITPVNVRRGDVTQEVNVNISLRAVRLL